MKINILLITIVIFTTLGLSLLWIFTKEDNKTENYKKYLTNDNVKKTPNNYSAWIAWWNDDREVDLAIKSLENQSDKIKTIMPMWYRLNSDGKIELIEESTKRSEIKELALAKNIDILATITNDFDPQVVSTLLDNQELQVKEIENLVFIAISNGYKGIDLDWEEMYVGDKDGFNYFVENLSNALHAKGLILSVTVQAQTSTSVDSPSAKAQDWAELAKYADQIRIMGYDFHHSTSTPGPVTPLDLYQKMLELAVKTIPLEKLIIGLPTYGYDWVNSEGKTLQYTDAVALYEKLKINPVRDSESGALWFKYTVKKTEHKAWFEDIESTKVKIDMAQSLGIYNFTFWRLGGEDERIWSL